MKELVSAVTQAASNRLKSPILGSFILAWFAVNHTETLTFFYSSPEVKVELLKQAHDYTSVSWTNPMLMNVIYPALFAMAYTFGLPLIQHHIDKAKHEKIDKARLEAQHDRQKHKYESLSAASEAQARSSLDYWRDKLSRDLNDWEAQRSTLKNLINDLEQELEHQKQLRQSEESETRHLQSQLNSSTELQAELSVQIKTLSASLEDMREKHHQHEVKYQENKIAYQQLLDENNTAKGVLDRIATLNVDEVEQLHNHYLSNPNFRAQVLNSVLNNKEFSDELLSNEQVLSMFNDYYNHKKLSNDRNYSLAG